jgi:Cation transport ATPase
VKVVTGDNAVVALHVCAELRLPGATALSGQDVAAMNDTELAAAIERTTVFARRNVDHLMTSTQVGSAPLQHRRCRGSAIDAGFAAGPRGSSPCTVRVRDQRVRRGGETRSRGR